MSKISKYPAERAARRIETIIGDSLETEWECWRNIILEEYCYVCYQGDSLLECECGEVFDFLKRRPDAGGDASAGRYSIFSSDD